MLVLKKVVSSDLDAACSISASSLLSGVNGDTCADVLFGSPAPGSNGDASNGGKEAAAMANGVAPVSGSAEAEQLQAHVSGNSAGGCPTTVQMYEFARCWSC